MSDNELLLQKLEKLLKWKKSKKFYAEKLEISESEVDDLLTELRNKVGEDDEYDVSKYIEKVNIEKGTRESTIVTDFEPKNDKKLAKLHKINLDKYVITNYWSKQLPSGKFTSSVFSKLKKPEDYSAEDFSKFLEKFKPKNLEIHKCVCNNSKEHIDVELSISDYHLAKRYINDGNNNIKDRALAFFDIAKDLISKVKSAYNLNTVIFPISNDFFHTDNYQNSTTNGTPQDIIAEYDNEYEVGFELLVNTINMLRQNANDVKVVLVQGNHDRTKSFYLAHGLDVFFKNDLDVEFIRHHSTTKGIVTGNTFIGYHHGNCKIDELPLIFATDPDYSEAFGKCKYREVHTGDKHHYMAKEIKGVRIQQMPSLSGTDRWHKDNNYVNNVRAALLLGYNSTEGKCCEFEKRI